MSIESLNPTTNESIAIYEQHSPDAMLEAVSTADRTYLEWSRSTFQLRAEILERAAVLLEERADDLAQLMAREMGKPVVEGVGEVKKCASICRYYAENGAAQLAPEAIETEHAYSGLVYRPLGVVLAVMPWNFPLWQVFRAAAPTMMAGNVMMLKHASNVTGCALAIEKLVLDAGAPIGALTTLVLSSSTIADLIGAAEIKAVTLTGSTGAGRAVGEAAGRHIKPCVLELGGSDPYVVLEDADLELAVEKCVTSRLINSGQSCIAAKRFIVVEAVRAEFTERFVAAVEKAVVGDPLDVSTTIGPQARADLRDSLHDQVARSIANGARCLTGGEIPNGPGAFYPPTVLDNVLEAAPAYTEELFGPVAAIIAAANEQTAIHIANDTCFGLGAAVFTADIARGRRLAEDELHAGTCVVNDFVRSHPHLPFGGIKLSGVGRELGALGIRSFVNAKTVVVAG